MTSTASSKKGILYIVATPIGNRNDISARAITTLQEVDTILAEDTRHSKPLLTNLGINKPLLSLHAYNENNSSEIIINALLKGQSFALISDAGTPLISDPGYPLVNQAHLHSIDVIPIPGPCAIITALSAAGIPCDVFTFYGFLPAKSTARQNKLKEMYAVQNTLVFYESTHRIIDCLKDVEKVFGADCQIVLAKELTKHFERFIRNNVASTIQLLQADLTLCKGEFVIIIPARNVDVQINDGGHVLKILLNELPLKQAVALAAKLTDVPKNKLYEMALSL